MGNKIRLWDTNTWELTRTLEADGLWVNSLTFSSDGSTLASGGWGNKVGLWDTRTWEQKQILGEHYSVNGSVAFSPGRVDARQWD